MANNHDPVAYALLKTIPGIGKILGHVILYEIENINRFPSVQDFASYARLVKCSKESNGKKEKTLSILAHKVGRAVYFMLKNKKPFNQNKFPGLTKNPCVLEHPADGMPVSPIIPCDLIGDPSRSIHILFGAPMGTLNRFCPSTEPASNWRWLYQPDF